MKTSMNFRTTERFEFAKRILSSFQVLIIGIMLPVLFVVGITKDTTKESYQTEKSVNKTNHAAVQGVVNFTNSLPDQNG